VKASIRKATWAGLAGVLLVAVPPDIGMAQETRGSEFPDLEEEPGVLDYVKLRLTLAERYIGDTDFGAFSTTSHQPEGRLRLTVPLAKNAAFRLMGGGRALLYDFDGPTDFFELGTESDEPFGNLYSWGIRGQIGYLLDEHWTLFSDDERWALLLEGGAKSSWESGSDMQDGLRGGGSIGVGYRFANRLELAVGFSIRTQLLDGGVGVGPLFEFDWRISERWKLKSYGTGLQLEFDVSEDLTVRTRARIESSSFRLDERPGGVGKGSLRVRQLPVGLGVQWRPWDFLRLRIIAGAMTLNNLRVKNEDGDVLGSSSSNVAPYFSVRVDLRN
jgi:hypothetical protein